MTGNSKQEDMGQGGPDPVRRLSYWKEFGFYSKHNGELLMFLREE